jgi:hypothetical protein
MSVDLHTSNNLLPSLPSFIRVFESRVKRDPGAQSVDRYWDLKNLTTEHGLIPSMISFRERIKTSTFMTWTASDERRALNLELPFVGYERSAVITRLEFNWIDNLQLSIADFVDRGTVPTDNPLILSARMAGIEGKEFEPVLEHTTFCEKYLLHENVQELFHLNVDHVIPQALKTMRIATYTDIDIAPSLLVDDKVLAPRITFIHAIADRYNLTSIDATKVWRDALLIGEM